MRIEELKIYKFTELSDKAKTKAIEKYREGITEIHWQDELFDSFKAVYSTAGIKLKDYSLGLNSYSYVKIDLDKDDPVYNLTGARAIGWMENNLYYKLRIPRSKRKEYAKYGRYYRTGMIKPCPFTGYCADDDFIDCINEELKAGTCIGEIFRLRLPEKYVQLLEQEWENQTSDEYIKEHMEINEYEFLEDGSIY